MKTFKNKKEFTDWVETIHLQNANGRESSEEMFRLGVEATLEELLSPEALESFEKGAALKTPILVILSEECPNAPCCPNLKHGILECACCNWSEI